jgi:hypothetical protein
MSTTQINALLEERRGYVVRKKLERVRDVDEELARLGYTPSGSPPPVEREVVTAPGRADATPKKKSAPRKKA